MGYLLTHFWPGGTEEQYRKTLAVVHPDGLPEGQRFHAAASTDEGLIVIAVWDSKENSEKFVNETLSKGQVDGGLVGPPQERSGEIVNEEQTVGHVVDPNSADLSYLATTTAKAAAKSAGDFTKSAAQRIKAERAKLQK